MSEVENREASGTRRRLVLGFDAECVACSDLARRIEKRVGDKLEVRSLRDPQVEEWRKRALGEDASWAPTLIEVKGLRVRAWTGRRMGLALSRTLGPVATWRVLQVLGEIGAAKNAEGSPIGTLAGLSRGQFIKGVTGLALATSVLPSAAMFSSTAEAKKRKGGAKPSKAEENKALATVRSSEQFKKLASEQRQAIGKPGNGYGYPFNFKDARVEVSENKNLATVAVESEHPKRDVVAVFHVDLERRAVFFYRHQELLPNGEGSLIVSSYNNGDPLGEPEDYSQLTAYKEYVVTKSGRKLSYQQFKEEAEGRRRSSRATVRQSTVSTAQYTDECGDCEGLAEIECAAIEAAGCGLAGALIGGAAGAPFTPAGAAIAAGVAGFVAGITCGIYAAATDGCDSYTTSRCFEYC